MDEGEGESSGLLTFTIFGRQHLDRNLDPAPSWVEEGGTIPHDAAGLADVVGAGQVAKATEVVDGAEEALFARVGVTGIRYQGDMVFGASGGLLCVCVCVCVCVNICILEHVHNQTKNTVHIHTLCYRTSD